LTEKIKVPFEPVPSLWSKEIENKIVSLIIGKKVEI
jgi:hypothetical protein